YANSLGAMTAMGPTQTSADCLRHISGRRTPMKLPRGRRLLYLSRIAVTIGFAIALTAPTPSDAAEIRILTTRAMNHVLTELAGAFQRTSEHKITLILAPPNEIKNRIVNGEIVDRPALTRSTTLWKKARSHLLTG